MRIAISGSHATGKSTLIAAFLERHPEYRHEPEAYELLADDVQLASDGEGPTPEGLDALLRHTLAGLAVLEPGTDVIVERSPVDYIAYAAASGRSWSQSVVAAFLQANVPLVRRALGRLDLIALLPVSRAIEGRPDEDARFRKRVDERLRRALIDDEHDLFGPGAARAVELSPLPARQLAELLRLAGGPRAIR
jgi:hypothetical protein